MASVSPIGSAEKSATILLVEIEPLVRLFGAEALKQASLASSVPGPDLGGGAHGVGSCRGLGKEASGEWHEMAHLAERWLNTANQNNHKVLDSLEVNRRTA